MQRQGLRCWRLGRRRAHSQAGIDAALLAKATAGDAAAQVAVGESYAAGEGVAQDYRLAAEWYQRAADKGTWPESCIWRRFIAMAARISPRDMAQAAAWYQKAADQGDVGAQGTMGTLYSMGQGVEQSYVEAYYWLDLAAAVKGPKQEQYAAYRQMMGAHITADELAEVQEPGSRVEGCSSADRMPASKRCRPFCALTARYAMDNANCSNCGRPWKFLLMSPALASGVDFSPRRAEAQQSVVTLTPAVVEAGSPVLIHVEAPDAAKIDGEWMGHKLEFFRGAEWTRMVCAGGRGRGGRRWALDSADRGEARRRAAVRDLSRTVEIHAAHYRTGALTVAPKFVEPGPEAAEAD